MAVSWHHAGIQILSRSRPLARLWSKSAKCAVSRSADLSAPKRPLPKPSSSSLSREGCSGGLVVGGVSPSTLGCPRIPWRWSPWGWIFFSCQRAGVLFGVPEQLGGSAGNDKSQHLALMGTLASVGFWHSYSCGFDPTEETGGGAAREKVLVRPRFVLSTDSEAGSPFIRRMRLVRSPSRHVPFERLCEHALPLRPRLLDALGPCL